MDPSTTTFTPWGRADDVKKVADGITEVSTASHGGVHLSPARNEAVPAALRNDDGWYEQDCEAAVASWLWPEAFAAEQVRAGADPGSPWTDPAHVRVESAKVLDRWLPERFAAALLDELAP